MNGKRSPEEANPSAWWGLILGSIGSLITLAIAFGVPLTADQETAILGFLASLSPFVTAYLISRKAWSPASVQSVVEEAAATATVPERAKV